MAHRSVIPFGPQHPVLPEPLHLDLVIEDDRVIEAIPQIGFVHRGLEKLIEKRAMHQFGYIAERICGICAVATIWMPVPSATTGLYATVYALVHSMAAHFGQNKGAVGDGKSAEVQNAVKAVKGK